jgi:hypothetical protein
MVRNLLMLFFLVTLLFVVDGNLGDSWFVIFWRERMGRKGCNGVGRILNFYSHNDYGKN